MHNQENTDQGKITERRQKQGRYTPVFIFFGGLLGLVILSGVIWWAGYSKGFDAPVHVCAAWGNFIGAVIFVFQAVLLWLFCRRVSNRSAIKYFIAIVILIPIQLLSFFSGAELYAGAQVNSMKSRDYASLRSIADALEEYAIICWGYPPTLDILTTRHVFDPPFPLKGFKDDPSAIISELGPYINELPCSAFGKNLYPHYFALKQSEQSVYRSYWIAWFPGPDKDYDIMECEELEEAIRHIFKKGFEEMPPWILNRTYDPSNGTFEGDVFRIKM